MNRYLKELKKSSSRIISLLVLLALIAAGIYISTRLLKYMGTGIGIGAIAGVIIIGALVWLCHYKKPMAALIIELILMMAMIPAIFAVGKLDTTLDKIGNTKQYEVIQIVALADSGITAESDFSSYVFGYDSSDDQAYDKGSEILAENDKKVAVSKPYDNTEKAYAALKDRSCAIMVLTSTTRSDLSVIDEEYEDKIKVIFEKKYPLDEVKVKAVDIEKEPFTIYLCGADLSSGSDITSTGRGDVNILLTINPKTEKVYMQVIPRDTFVYVPAKGGSSKLSYSGWWGGVQSSIDSIEDKFGVEINYYAKLNFNGLTQLVDALGGVTVNSYYTYSYKGASFVKGENFVDGETALLFARARKMLPENELSRGQHQMELIKAIFRKYAEDPTFEKGMAVIDELSNNFVTNIPEEDYYKAFKVISKVLPELQTMENHSIKGTYEWHYDEVRPTYYLYYYYPAEGEIERVRDSIEAIKKGE